MITGSGGRVGSYDIGGAGYGLIAGAGESYIMANPSPYGGWSGNLYPGSSGFAGYYDFPMPQNGGNGGYPEPRSDFPSGGGGGGDTPTTTGGGGGGTTTTGSGGSGSGGGSGSTTGSGGGQQTPPIIQQPDPPPRTPRETIRELRDILGIGQQARTGGPFVLFTPQREIIRSDSTPYLIAIAAIGIVGVLIWRMNR